MSHDNSLHKIYSNERESTIKKSKMNVRDDIKNLFSFRTFVYLQREKLKEKEVKNLLYT